MKTCEVCGLRKLWNTEKTFHRFPSNRTTAQLWCEALSLNIDNLMKYSVICSDHFLPHHISRMGGRTKISKGAIPVLNPHDESACEATREIPSPTTENECFIVRDSNSSCENELPELKPIPKPLDPKAVAIAKPKMISQSKNFQDIFQKKIRHEILTDIARERMQLRRTADSKPPPLNSVGHNETELQNQRAKPFAEPSQRSKSVTFPDMLDAKPKAAPHQQTPVSSSDTSIRGKAPLSRERHPPINTDNVSNPLLPQPGLMFISPTPALVKNSSVIPVPNASETLLNSQNAPQILKYVLPTPSNASVPVNPFIIIPQTLGVTPNGLFLLPQGLAQQNIILPPLNLLPSHQQTGQIPVSTGMIQQTSASVTSQTHISKHSQINSSFANTTTSKVKQVDSNIVCPLSNSSTDTASETSYFMHNSNMMDESFSMNSRKGIKSRCRTCLDPVSDQLEQASILMMCFEEKTVKKGLVHLFPEMNSTLSDDQFVCAKCFLLLRNTLKFMKKCLEAESVIVKELKNNSEKEYLERGFPDIEEEREHMDIGASFPEKNTVVEAGNDFKESDFDKAIMLDEDINDEYIDDEDIEDNDEEDNDSAFEVDPNVDERDYILNGITNLIRGRDGLKTKDIDGKQSDLENAVIKHLNFLPLKHAEVRDHNSIVSIGHLEPEFIFSLQQNKIRLLQNCSKFDENIFTKKRVLLLGGHTEVKCLLCEKYFNTEAIMQDHISDIHGLSQAFLTEAYCFQYKPDSSNSCEACGKDCRNGVDKKIHLRNCYVFPCPYCDEWFSSGQLPNHTSTEHNDSRPFKCFRCKQEKVTFMKFKSHLCNALICEICGKNFLSKNNFSIHKARCKSEEARKCSECKQRFSVSSFSSHVKTHEFPCSICGKIFHRKINLKKHERNHRVKRTSLCPLCGKVVSYLEQHMRIHENNRIKNVKCSLCPKSFFSRANLMRHVTKCHMITRITCGKCGKLCNEYDIESHYDSQHPHEWEYNCAQCEATFTRIAFLRQHAKSHATEEEELEKGRKPAKPRNPRVPRCDTGFLKKYKIRIKAPDAPITCKYCLKTLKGLLNYRQHLETHLKLYRYKCRYCEMTYSTPSNKIRHEKIHKDPKYNFRCDECWKIMTSQEELDSHMVWHADKPKRYQCGECFEMFCREYQLRTHLVNKHTQQGEIEEARDEMIKDALMDFAV